MVTRKPPAAPWVEIEEGAWTVAYRLVAGPSGPVIAELRVFPTAGRTVAGEFSGDPVAVPAGGVNSEVMRIVRLHAHRAIIEAEAQSEPGFRTPQLDRDLADLRSLIAFMPPGGRPPVFLALLARVYVALVESGERRPNRAIARLLERRPDWVRNALNQARKRGYLSRPSKERTVGGELTEAAERLLREGRRRMREVLEVPESR